METREELLEKLRVTTIELLEVEEEIKGMEPHVARVEKGEKMIPFVVTEESLAKHDEAEKRRDALRQKKQEIERKLREAGRG